MPGTGVSMSPNNVHLGYAWESLQQFTKLLDGQTSIAGNPPMVNALTGLCRGMVTMRAPLLMTMCFPWRTIRKPAFSSARTACR